MNNERDGTIGSFWEELPDPAGGGLAVTWGTLPYPSHDHSSSGLRMLGWEKMATHMPRSGFSPGDLWVVLAFAVDREES